ncbi:hypothetical protein FACS1894198_5520 [Clostridia bacterium]|nr:hypothetical protein FACS1894198_5520 [Clostridia bacterium]
MNYKLKRALLLCAGIMVTSVSSLNAPVSYAADLPIWFKQQDGGQAVVLDPNHPDFANQTSSNSRDAIISEIKKENKPGNRTVVFDVTFSDKPEMHRFLSGSVNPHIAPEEAACVMCPRFVRYFGYDVWQVEQQNWPAVERIDTQEGCVLLSLQLSRTRQLWDSILRMQRDPVIATLKCHEDTKPVLTAPLLWPFFPGMPTKRNFIVALLQPVGKTLFVWAGGYGATGNVPGPGALCHEPLPSWYEFFKTQGSDYKYYDPTYGPGSKNPNREKYEVQKMSGLDCGAEVGRALTICRKKENRNDGFALNSIVASCSARDWGEVTEVKDVKDYKPGDIMHIKGEHVWVCLGACKDGSVLLVHASPPGVHLCGTTLPDKEDTDAVLLATKYMAKYFSEWHAKFSAARPLDEKQLKDGKVQLRSGYARDGGYYLPRSRQFRLDVSGLKFMSDPDGYTNKSPEEILQDSLGPC